MPTSRSAAGTAPRRDARLEQRLSRKDKALIEAAAALVGLNASEFMLARGLEAARATLARFQVTVALAEDAAALAAALDESAPPTEALAALMRADLGGAGRPQ